MAYSADTFVADEQPTTAKWNKLWSNDASFNDGTGIGDDTIDSRHYVTNSIDAEHLATDAIKLGITSVTASVNWTTVETDIASVTVTVPAGGRDVLLKGVFPQLQSTVGTDRSVIQFKESSTVLNRYYHGMQNPGQGVVFEARISAPSAGSHTYKITGTRDVGSGTQTAYADATGSTLYLLATLT